MRFLVEVPEGANVGSRMRITQLIEEELTNALLLEGGVRATEITPYEISQYDREHIGDVIANGTWFTATLLRLIAKSDPERRARFRVAFPEVVDLYEEWMKGSGE